MGQTPPIYQAQKRTYVVDTCEPQRRAIDEGKIEFHALTHGHYPGERLKRGTLSGVSSMGYWDAVGPQDWGLEAHRNEGIEIVLLETGGMPFSVDKSRYDLTAGDLTITRPWQLHRLGSPDIGPGRLHWVIFDVGVRRPDQAWRWPSWVSITPEDLDELTTLLRHNETPVWRSTPAARCAFGRIAEAIKDRDTPNRISRIQVELSVLLLEILQMLRSQGGEGDPGLTSAQRTVALFLEDLEHNPASLARQWTLKEMAEHCGMKVTAFTKYCRKITNTSPAKYLARCRLNRAAHLLANEPQITITRIAF
jgi:AraC family L-rhamnose operon regulatory protein RhaS